MSAFSKRLTLALAPPLAVGVLRMLGASWRHIERGRTELSPLRDPKAQRLFAIWHESILVAVWHYRGIDIRPMISRNYDGELIARAMDLLGFPKGARGSSSRGGSTALKDMAEGLRQGGNAILTPDGPRGPRHQAHSGVVVLGKLTGLPVVPVGVAVAPCLRLRSWDRFRLPLPFAKVCFHFGDPIHVAPDAGPEAVEALRLAFQAALLQANAEAEAALGPPPEPPEAS
jgi:lysophospholipid acyltransferase (LPLAT)-like uncharacterized protein